MEPNIGIAPKSLRAVTSQLSIILSNEVTLYIKTRKFHWNVRGNNFMELHKLFEDQYFELEQCIDDIGERINKLGSYTIGTMKEYASFSAIEEHPDEYPSASNMILELLEDHEGVIMLLRANIKKCTEKYQDAGTADFLTILLQVHETMAWTLRRYLD